MIFRYSPPTPHDLMRNSNLTVMTLLGIKVFFFDQNTGYRFSSYGLVSALQI